MGDEAAPPIIIPTNYGRIDEFDDISEDWIQYTERLNHYFIANNIENMEKQRAILLSACGKKTYKLMRNLSAPKSQGKRLMMTLLTTLDDMLRDRLVCGIKEDRIQRRLLAEPGLTFKKAMEVATATEMAAKNAHDLQVQEPKQVHKVTIRSEECYRCGGSHNATDCKLRDAKCYVCDKKGRLAKKCRNKGKQNAKEKPKFKQQTQQGKVYPKQRPTKTHFIEEDSDDMEDTYTMYQLGGTKRKPYLVSVKLNNTEINMEIDTGASVSVISQETCKQVFGSDNSLEKSPCSLRTYTGEKIDVLGKRNVTNIYNSQSVDLPITMVKGTGPSLMGRDWLHKLQLNWKSIFKIDQLSHNQEPEKDKELQDLLLPIVKSDKSVRISGDYKVTINQVSKLDNYPIPKTDDLYATLSGGQAFSKLDLSQAYQQIVLDEESRKYVTINTHKGLYQYNRLPFGVSSAPGIFKKTMENLLQGIPRVVVRVDDILITGSSKSEHLNNLETVLGKIQESGMRLNKDKCVFLAPEVVYLGHRIDQYGIYPVESKVNAITEAPEPKHVTELKSYLGMLNYYNRFLPNLSSKLAPLHELLKKQKQWEWDKSQQEAFELSKTLLRSSKVLGPSSAQMEDGCDRPVGYVSRTLAPAERNYSVLEKEELAVIIALKKFHQYLFDRKFTIYTDHKPLIGLFNENKCIPPMAAERIQRWALTLSSYEYKIFYKEGKKNFNADALSRLPLNREGKTEVPAEIIMLMDHMGSTPATAQQIKAWTRKDPILGQITNYVLKGWPNYRDNDDMKLYFSRKTELSVFDSCLLWGNRVVITNPGREIILQELHEGHQGISRIKVLARGYVWWPNMDAEIEQTVRACHKCQVNRHAPPEAPMHPWEWPSKPWSRIHIDYAGPLYGKCS
ncbi:unnamed protein product [Mytilus coruscus]|uniref:RNA-directed DNA polymerase n=1 Tax=Mytilus coruscus TaxID=42192 RepID=A0A6J8CWB4_MYTCO|nr:unnamed protein product [Mytilus coruscus]